MCYTLLGRISAPNGESSPPGFTRNIYIGSAAKRHSPSPAGFLRTEKTKALSGVQIGYNMPTKQRKLG